MTVTDRQLLLYRCRCRRLVLWQNEFGNFACYKVTGLTVRSYHGVSMGERVVAEEMDDIREVVEVPCDNEIQIQPK